MTTIDMIGAIALTASAAIEIAVLSRAGARSDAAAIGAAVGYGLWFALVVALGATGALDALGTPGLGVAVAAPLLILGIFGRRRLAAIPPTTLIATNTMRVLGVFFIALFMQGRLPAPFAPVAGWGDIVIGVTALPVAWTLRRGLAGARTIAVVWNALGLLDLIAALTLGVTSAEGSPVRIFFSEHGSAAMTSLPWLLIPAFLVPNLILMHLAIFRQLNEGKTATARPALAESPSSAG